MCLQGISSYEACSKYPEVYSKLQQLEQQLSGGTTATLILIYNNKIYVANVGMWDLSLHRSARTGGTTATLILICNNKVCVANVGMWDLSLHRSARRGRTTATRILNYNNKVCVATVGM